MTSPAHPGDTHLGGSPGDTSAVLLGVSATAEAVYLIGNAGWHSKNISLWVLFTFSYTVDF